MTLYILMLTVSFRLDWDCSLKERRQLAQKARDRLRSKFNASVKLVYEQNGQKFEVHYAEIGEGRDYLESQVDAVMEYVESFGEATVSISYEIQEFI